jgi:hypothetical protein
VKPTQLSTDPRSSTPTGVAAGQPEPCNTGPVYRVRRRLGYCLGGIMLGAAGYVLGDFPPYPPVDLVCLSIAYGCFALLAGALLNVRAKPAPAPSRPCPEAPEQPSTEGHDQALPVSEVHLGSLQPLAGGPNTLVLRSFPCVIGRHPECDHRLPCPYISRRHCALSLRDGRAWVHDLNSRHGTYLNGAAITGGQPLADGDQLELGPVPFRVCLVRKGSDPLWPSPDRPAIAEGSDPFSHRLLVQP